MMTRLGRKVQADDVNGIGRHQRREPVDVETPDLPGQRVERGEQAQRSDELADMGSTNQRMDK